MTSAHLRSTEIDRSPLRRRFLYAGIGALLLLPPVVAVIDHYWPYRYRNVEPTLESVFASQIKIDHYHRTYFPYPGFVADGVTLRRDSAPNLPPVGSIVHIRVEGRWIDLLLFRRVIHRIIAEGLHVVIPPVGSNANHQDFPPGSANDFTGPTTTIQQLDIRDAQLDILRNNGGRYVFPIQASGAFGPLLANQLGPTPVTGNFSFTEVALTGIGSLHGTLASSGHFQGTLASIEAFATSSIPDFAVSTARPIAISATSSGSISALNGDISLRAIDLSTNHGRAEDLLHPFLSSSSPIAGPIQLHSHAVLAPATGRASFLHRLTLSGAFDIPSQRLTDPSTEKSLTAFSQRAQGHPSPTNGAPEADVLSSLDGTVNIREGVAHAPRLNFQFPGAAIQVAGTFDLNSEAVNMQGNLRMQTDISHVTTGFKSYLLKPLAPFFKHKNAGAVVPIAITGLPNHYKINQNVLHLDPPPVR
jgi:hypothetical protein